MTLILPNLAPGGAGSPDVGRAAYTDNVIPWLRERAAAGERVALVTLVGVEGSAPRAPGAQMAVSETGEWAGYISGGCLEQAIALEGIEAIAAGRHRLIRYGQGSPYLDIRLPCGSGLDLLVQPSLPARLVEELAARVAARRPSALRLSLTHGGAVLSRLPPKMQSRRLGDDFERVYQPALRCLIAGAGPVAVYLARLAAQAGFETQLHTPGLEALPAMPSSIAVRSLRIPFVFEADKWTAAILAFHDHDQELPVLAALLDSACFYLAAIGSHQAHEARKLALREGGFGDRAIARVKGPAGLIPGLKTAPFTALSILAEIVAAARDQHLAA